jgi:hypothetical protein
MPCVRLNDSANGCDLSWSYLTHTQAMSQCSWLSVFTCKWVTFQVTLPDLVVLVKACCVRYPLACYAENPQHNWGLREVYRNPFARAAVLCCVLCTHGCLLPGISTSWKHAVVFHTQLTIILLWCFHIKGVMLARGLARYLRGEDCNGPSYSTINIGYYICFIFIWSYS